MYVIDIYIHINNSTLIANIANNAPLLFRTCIYF